MKTCLDFRPKKIDEARNCLLKETKNPGTSREYTI